MYENAQSSVSLADRKLAHLHYWSSSTNQQGIEGHGVIPLRGCDLMKSTQILGLFLITETTNKETRKGLKALDDNIWKQKLHSVELSRWSGGHSEYESPDKFALQ